MTAGFTIQRRHPHVMTRSCAFVLAALITAIAGCAGEARLIRNTPEGGLVSYGFETDGEVLTSSGRREALRLIADKCPNGSRIVREGEIPNVSKKADRAWRGQIGMKRLWGVEFTCR
jgi:hypothetical protein